MNEAEQRRQLGAEGVGVPAKEIREAIARLAAMEEYQRIRYDAVEFYCDRFLCRELIALIDESWSLEDLASANPIVVKVSFLLLLRDMMQAHRAQIVVEPDSQSWDTQCIEQFIVGLFYETQSPIQPYQDWLSVVESQTEEESAMLLLGLARQLSLDPPTLYQYQMAAREVTFEETLS